MNDARSKLIPILRKCSEDIETYSLNDRNAWDTLSQLLISKAVERSEANHSEEPLSRLLHACARGAAAIGEKRLKDYIAAIDAIVESLETAETYLAQNDGDTSTLQEQLDRLEVLFPETDPPPVRGLDAAASALSLDDISAMWIQAEPGSTEELQSIREAMCRLSGSGTLSTMAREQLDAAVLRLQEILDDGVADIDNAMDEIGQLLEAASELNDLQEDRQSEIPATAPEPGDDAPVAETGIDAAIDGEETAVDTPAPSAPDATDHMPEDPDFDLLGEFVDESNEQIANAEEALLGLETDPEDMDAVGTVFRAFHTIKGTSAFLELSIISEMGHHAENLLSRVRDKEIQYAGGYADLSLRALDMLKEMVGAVQEAFGGKPLLKPAGYDELLHTLSNPEACGISERVDSFTPPRIGDLLVAQGKVEREDVEQAVRQPRLGDILVAQGNADRESIESAISAEDGETPLGMRMVRSKTAKIQDVGQALRTQKQMKAGQRALETSVRVGTERLDRLIDMVGELVIAHSMVAQDDLVADGSRHELVRKVAHTSKIVRELQDISMSLRMVPLKGTFNKMARLVRDVSRKLGKKVEFITEGEETEIDRNLVDVINDPLVHMIRNAVDHGIESPDERTAVGKPETGVVKLCAYHSAGSVVVEIQDDGKGLDRNAILDKAARNGLVPEGAHLSDREIYNLIFEPGFSTAAEVTDVSGRGVGMDVVRKNIESLRGQTEIQSTVGKGSVFKMSLPLTLAIIDGMVVRVGGEDYVIPTVSIVKSIKPDAKDLSSVHGKGEMIAVQGELIPMMRLADLYDIVTADRDSEQELVIIVEDERSKAGVVIDELVGRQQVVIKTLGDMMRHIPGISGSAIMPNGRVGLILDVGSLLKHANSCLSEGASDDRSTESETETLSQE